MLGVRGRVRALLTKNFTQRSGGGMVEGGGVGGWRCIDLALCCVCVKEC